MKKFIRIMGLALVLTLLCSSIAFAAPRKLADIEGLPEMPDFSAIPTMTTKHDAETMTVSLSAPLAWLCAIRNWEWIPVTFGEDGVTGTVGIDPSLQIGFAKGSWAAGWMDDSYIEDWGKAGGFWVNDDEELTEEDLDALVEEAVDAAPAQYQTHAENWLYDEEEDNWYYAGEDPHTVLYRKKNGDAYVEDIPGEGGIWYNVLPYYDQHGYAYSTYALNGYGMAFEGETTDGLKVRYDSYGKLMEVIATLTGVNFLGAEEAPTKTELYYEKVTAGYGKTTTYWVLRSIKEYYGQDENGNDIATQVKYSYNGNYDTTVK